MKPGAIRGTVVCDMSSMALFRGHWASLVIHRDRADYATAHVKEPRQALVVEIVCDDEGEVTVSIPSEFRIKVWGDDLSEVAA